MTTIVYIDGANLHQGSKSWGGIDYRKLFQRFADKYKPSAIYLFIGYIKGKESSYSHLSCIGYTLIFKETLVIDGKTKGNVDAELVVQSMKDFYEISNTKTILVTGDGDFACLVNFFLHKHHHIIIIAPNRVYLSYLLKKTNVPIVFLEEQKHKIQKKAPTRDEL